MKPCHEYCLDYPAMSAQEFDELCASIEENGLLDPVLIYKDQVIDGRHRQLACEKLGIEPAYEELVMESTDEEGIDEEIFEFCFDKNVNRRQLSASQRALLVAQREQRKQSVKKKRGRPKKDAENKSAPVQIDAKKQAEKAGVSERTQRDAILVAEKASKKTNEAVKLGELSVKKAAEQIREAEKPVVNKQPEVKPLEPVTEPEEIDDDEQEDEPEPERGDRTCLEKALEELTEFLERYHEDFQDAHQALKEDKRTGAISKQNYQKISESIQTMFQNLSTASRIANQTIEFLQEIQVESDEEEQEHPENQSFEQEAVSTQNEGPPPF